jgi:hypothetical protein
MMNFIERRLTLLHHLSDESISRLLSGELNAIRTMSARAHIAKCWRCRLRREALNKAAMRVAEYRRAVSEAIPPGARRREMLLADLRKRSDGKMRRPHPARAVFHFFHRLRNQMIPFVASVAIIVSAVCLLVWVWRSPAPSMSAAQLLNRAVLADRMDSHEKTGVIYQKVSISTAHGKVEHEIYRDLHSIRRRRPEILTAEVEPVHQVLSSVGVDWQAPLSADSYRQWHDRQLSVSDHIKKTGDDLLTLVSKAANGPIEEESLTIRVSDFHPVERTVESRDYGTIEIAELNYAVLDWSGVNEALFEPLSGLPHPPRVVTLPPLPTNAELDNAELAARLVLNRLHADEGEQISVSRSSRTVEVKGVVETEARKQEIASKLSVVPHVSADLLSLDELQVVVPNQPVAVPVQVQSMDALASPLEKSLADSGRRQDLEATSRSLLDASLKIKQNAAQLLSLRRTFPASGDAKSSAFVQLSQSYAARLQSSLAAETSTLDALQIARPKDLAEGSAAIDLSAEVDRNEALCRELITGSGSSARSAAEIIPDLYKTIAAMRLALAIQLSPDTH